MILWGSCRHAAVDYYFVEISTLIVWVRIVRVLKKLLETYNLVQHITEPTYRSQHLLGYTISDAELVNSAGISDFVSDHCALHASLVCTRSHPKQKQITFRPLKTIDHNLLSTDIGKIDFNLDSIVDNYNTVFTSLFWTVVGININYLVLLFVCKFILPGCGVLDQI